ncbi:MAG TPA: hypothetical protein VFN62_05200 [Acidobacteriaceae bacterium]|nr:hypothetical protein [Acidobacteriaceae bacterium]
MQVSWSAVSRFALALIAFSILSCGSHSSSLMGPTGPNGLQSITLAPSTADAKMYPAGQVPFVATGSYIDPVRTLTPQPAAWGVCQQNAPTRAVTVSKAGVGQCGMGAAGTYTVFAFVMTECNAITACGGGCTIVGTAQMTCP